MNTVQECVPNKIQDESRKLFFTRLAIMTKQSKSQPCSGAFSKILYTNTFVFLLVPYHGSMDLCSTAMEVDTVVDMEVTVVDMVVDMEVTVVDMEVDTDDEEATVDMEADTEVINNWKEGGG